MLPQDVMNVQLTYYWGKMLVMIYESRKGNQVNLQGSRLNLGQFEALIKQERTILD